MAVFFFFFNLEEERLSMKMYFSRVSIRRGDCKFEGSQ